MNRKTAWKAFKTAGAAAGGFLAAEYAGANYLFRRTLTRSGAQTERTIDMAGTDWNEHMPYIRSCKEWQSGKYREDVWTKSRDGLRLHGTYFPGCSWPEEEKEDWQPEKPKKLVLAFHGYSSDGMSDYTALSKFYIHDLGCAMLLADERSHGQSEGEYIGFGTLDRYDVLSWLSYVNERFGEDVDIYLHGVSMGAATVVMASGQKLPPNVKGIVSDCAFTSACDVFSHVLKSWDLIPPYPLLQIADVISKKKAGYGLREGDASREVEKAKVPILFIHGDKDTFVPCWMCDKIYDHCKAPKEKLIVSGAAHAESYYKNRTAYEEAVRKIFES